MRIILFALNLYVDFYQCPEKGFFQNFFNGRNLLTLVKVEYYWHKQKTSLELQYPFMLKEPSIQEEFFLATDKTECFAFVTEITI